MEINGKVVPFTATHYSFNSREFLRLTAGKYAQCYLDDKYWVDCAYVTNQQLIDNNTANYMKLFKTGLGRDFANLRLKFIGSSYRIGV